MKEKKPKVTKEQLRCMLSDSDAQAPSRRMSSAKKIEEAGEKLMASAAVITITALGGRVIIPPTAVSNGLSPQSIAALKNDFIRSFEGSVETARLLGPRDLPKKGGS